jgi:flagellar protein FlaI
MLAYLWLAIENKKSLMVIGGTASGKTSTLNALAFFIPPDAKIVSIEDTRELSLYQENWLPTLTREVPGVEKIDMYELVRAVMRQRPECLIVGEVRGVEALAMFQAICTGHTSFSTMHAGSIRSAVDRLEGEPIKVPRPMLVELDIVCLQLLTVRGKERIRRNQRIVEFTGLDPSTGDIRVAETYSWDINTDSFKKVGESEVLREIRRDRGLSPIEIKREFVNREKVLSYLAERQATYQDVASMIRQYYFDPAGVLEKISSGP